MDFKLDPVTIAARGAPVKPDLRTPKQRKREAYWQKQWNDIHQRHMQEHDEMVKREAADNMEALRLPTWSQALGVEGELPEFTRKVLGEAMAKDRLGPQLPKVNAYASDGGVPTAAHSYR